MSSIMTNASAMSALATLRSINNDMETTQNRISSGYKVDSASDNAAYWSIATTMRSDNKSLGTVQESLGLGKASVDIAYNAMESSIEIVQEIQKKLVSAKADNVDKAKIQGEITELQGQLSSIVNSASFNSENYLSADKSDTAKLLKSIVGSFNRDASGNATIENLDINTSGLVMVDTNADAESTANRYEAATVTFADDAVGATAGAQVSFTVAFDGQTFTFADGTTGEDIAKTLGAASFDNFVVSDLGSGELSVVRKEQGVQATADALTATGTFTITGSSATATVASTTTGSGADEFATGLLNQEYLIGAGESGAVTATLLNFDITNVGGEEATDAQLDAMIAMVDGVQSSMVDGASTLGAIQTRVDIQTDFLSNLMDSIDSGIGTLVDADMNEESTRLKALQTQQQLGIQALSIANSNSQNILQLFR